MIKYPTVLLIKFTIVILKMVCMVISTQKHHIRSPTMSILGQIKVCYLNFSGSQIDTSHQHTLILSNSLKVTHVYSSITFENKECYSSRTNDYNKLLYVFFNYAKILIPNLLAHNLILQYH
jgi:hypothetical protein